MNNQHIIIAIDGFSSTGKSTIAKQVAKRKNLIHVDTGAMYRAVTLYAIQNNLIDEKGNVDDDFANHLSEISIEFKYNKAEQINETYLNGQNVENEIREMRVANVVSFIAAIPEVRAFLVEQQRDMGKKQSLVMDGRDIGTVVFPKADYKFFITARPEVRAKRRYDELIAKGKDVNLEEITKNVIERDHIDTTRAISPLKKAEDAIEIDNSDLNREETLEKVLSYLTF
ncbi:(d)CMP kinase [Ornithobacterium rhinotracheale]|uniref:Cytidylate kinase n=1 Tax=Ornithobacterium rhinotracheale (strain ATCC 51463 / DSM 15997 / CCUG 23171 / CIP 104009 / LMG 9086) TaxID=867902 RepID=I4A3C8_ORNRL|nr:(d)CMP kinase [Ornithobacterium rhinotracheale]AFL98462.1 cytidylate kinase [Ornithobacterium rhinotracheale DSM 15997]AIQ00189.1 cytidylate kinase [Ornithobacterium rhinotracheale ORT-UMN 88]KGB65772.1 cytidylate kinase [Ornithobacterium rhinotracheale H06-030791]MBN3662888.1 (d)CMP kinase [Ornithobacterium rhinotracheale]MCK0193189.1 (d)CMP kinase [Ornithobacterium rhinotracheale]